MVIGTTSMFETGQDWKIAALRTSKCVCLFFIGDDMEEKYMELALQQARKSFRNGDVPVGAVIVKNGKVIAKGYNKKEKKKNAILHAEIVAISQACGKLKTWHLEECELYVTMEPCLMCAGAIVQSRIKKVYYGIRNEKFGISNFINIDEPIKINNHYLQLCGKLLEDKNKTIIQEFFKKHRK